MEHAAANNDDDIVIAYGEGRASVEDFLTFCRTYRGDADTPHFLLSEFVVVVRDEDDADEFGDRVLFNHLVLRVPEDRLIVFLEALIAEDPQVLTLTRGDWGCLLHLALAFTTSRRIHLLLAVPGTTRLLAGWGETPLHVACSNREVDPEVIHRLIDLDPGALTVTCCCFVPLHYALPRDASSTYVQRMVEMRPETLLSRDPGGLTPVGAAVRRTIWSGGPARLNRVAALRRFVEQDPQTVSLFSKALKFRTPLMDACDCYASLEDVLLARAILEAHPPSLVVPESHMRGATDPTPALPFEAAASSFGRIGMSAFVADETVHMALAVVEYVLGVSTTSTLALVGDSDMDVAANVAWFQGHIKHVIKQLAPGVQVEGASGLSMAQALRRHLHNHPNSATFTVGGLVRGLFCQDRVRELLRGPAFMLRSAVLCETVVDLYRLNRQGRDYRWSGEPQGLNVSAAWHQIDLLASLKDSATVESTYLQFREISRHSLLVLERQRRRRRVH